MSNNENSTPADPIAVPTRQLQKVSKSLLLKEKLILLSFAIFGILGALLLARYLFNDVNGFVQSSYSSEQSKKGATSNPPVDRRQEEEISLIGRRIEEQAELIAKQNARLDRLYEQIIREDQKNKDNVEETVAGSHEEGMGRLDEVIRKNEELQVKLAERDRQLAELVAKVESEPSGAAEPTKLEENNDVHREKGAIEKLENEIAALNEQIESVEGKITQARVGYVAARQEADNEDKAGSGGRPPGRGPVWEQKDADAKELKAQLESAESTRSELITKRTIAVRMLESLRTPQGEARSD